MYIPFFFVVGTVAVLCAVGISPINGSSPTGMHARTLAAEIHNKTDGRVITLKCPLAFASVVPNT